MNPETSFCHTESLSIFSLNSKIGKKKKINSSIQMQAYFQVIGKCCEMMLIKGSSGMETWPEITVGNKKEGKKSTFLIMGPMVRTVYHPDLSGALHFCFGGFQGMPDGVCSISKRKRGFWLCVWCVCSVMSDSLLPHGLSSARLLGLWICPSKNTRAGFQFLLQGIFRTQGSKARLLHWQADSFPLGHLGVANSKHWPSVILNCFSQSVK